MKKLLDRLSKFYKLWLAKIKANKKAKPISTTKLLRRRVPQFVILTLKVFIVGCVVYIILSLATAYFIYARHLENGFTQSVEKIVPYPAAVVDNNTISLHRLRWNVTALEKYNEVNHYTATHAEIQKSVLDQVSDRILYRKYLKENGVEVSKNSVDLYVAEISKQVGGEENLLKYLQDNYGSDFTIEKFRVWAKELLYESAIQEKYLTRVSLKHIVLVVPEGSTDVQIAEIQKKALEVKSKITDVNNFAAIAKEYSEDAASRDKGGDIGTTVRGVRTPDYFTKEFEDAVFALPVGAVSDPIRSSKGWHLVIVDKKEGSIDQSMADFTETLKSKAKIKYLL